MKKFHAISLVLFFAFVLSYINIAQAVDGPTSPKIMNTENVPQGDRVIKVTPQNIQSTLNSAVPGDIIELKAGVSYPPIKLPKKTSNEKWIIIRSDSANPSNPNFYKFPKAGMRVVPVNAGLMAKIVTPDSQSAIRTADGANHYWIIGLQIRPAANVSYNNGTLVVLGNADAATFQANDIVIDRSLIHGNADKEWRRGILMSGKNIAVINSNISEIHTKTYADASTPRKESHGINSYNGPGPYKIRNNFISAAGIGVLFGGSTSCSAEMIPSDIEISNNRFFKSTAWKKTAVPHWWVKNHLEFKSAKRVLVKGNKFENSWKDSAGDQKGQAIIFNPSNQVYGTPCDGNVDTNPWSQVADIRIVDNKFINAGRGITISAGNGTGPTKQTKNIRIANNLFYGTGTSKLLTPDSSWGDGRLFLIVTNKDFGVENLVIESNTAFQRGPIMYSGSLEDEADLGKIKPNTNSVFQNNIVNWRGASAGDSGIDGSGTQEGKGTFNVYFPGILFRQNIILKAPVGTAVKYMNESCADPNKLGCNFFISDPKFINFSLSNFVLSSLSPYKNKSTYYFINNFSRDIGVWNWNAFK